MKKIASHLFDGITKFAELNPGAITGLLAGGGIGALGGALFTGSDDPDDPEDSKSRLGRKVKNALIGALAGGAAGGGIGYALSENGPLRSPLPEDDVAPEVQAAHSGPVRALFGTAGFASGARMDRARQSDLASQIIEDLKNGTGVGGAAGRTTPPSTVEGLRSVLKDHAAAQQLIGSRFMNYGGPSELIARAQAAGIPISAEVLNKLDAQHHALWYDGANFKLPKLVGSGSSGWWKRIGRAALRNRLTAAGATAGLLAPEIAGAIGDSISSSDLASPMG